MQFRLGVQSWTIAILSVAVVLRVAWLIAYPGVIENEGAEYARLAENLLESGSYHGNFGPHVWFPHLFPGFIAALTIVLGDSEIAARLVSLLAGLLYIVAVGRLTEVMAGEEAARLAQIIAASHGLLVALSGSAYSEMTYMCLLTWGLYYGIRAVESTQVRIALIAGGFFALSFLVRPQAIIYPFITAVFIVGAGFVKRRSIRQSATAVTAMVLAFAVLIAPYVGWLSASSGYFRIEGKTVVNSVTSARMQSGMGYREAVRGLGPNLEPAGVYTYSDQFAVPKPAISRTITKSIFAEFPQRVSLLIQQFLTTKGLGWIAFLGLAVLGLVRAVYLRSKFLESGYYAFIGLSYLAILFSMQFGWSRHLFPLSILLIPWVGIGAAFLWEYLKGTPAIRQS
jgi:4-amino-4-deoxy-L-arabinose transferase-like glycosyltransferase